MQIERTQAVPMPRYHFGYRSRLGDIVELRDGRLLMAYKASTHSGGNVPAGGEGPGENVGIGRRTSTDGGRSWSPESILLHDLPGQGYYVHPSFLRLPTTCSCPTSTMRRQNLTTGTTTIGVQPTTV